MIDHSSDMDTQQKTTYSVPRRILEIVVVVLLAVIAVIPGVLHILYRADAQVALGNAKLVRTALETTALEAYGNGTPFGDPAAYGGVTEKAYQNIIMTSRTPGDFWVQQTDETGYEVLRFVYREGEYTVFFQAEPLSYEVCRSETYIKTHKGSEGP